jgi:hypothetical protein
MLNLILTDAATRMDDQDAQEQYFKDRCGRLDAECKKLSDVAETHWAADDVPMTLRVYAIDGVDENDLRHRIIVFAETLKIVVDGNIG